MTKKLPAMLCAAFMIFSFGTCQNGTGGTSSDNSSVLKSTNAVSTTVAKQNDTAEAAKEDSKESAEPEVLADESNKVLVAYFSCTGNTKKLAEYAAEITGGTLYEIAPAEPYTSADLDYNSDCRANREQNDSKARPKISGKVDNMDKYNVVFIGYPIWWGQAPKIMYTFLESYDFSGKTIVPFCTSGSSGIGSSAKNLHSLTSGANWLDGMRHSSSMSKNDMEKWINGLGLNF